ncbi:MAG: hypothetical protein Q9218_001138 [Villophora microphyllina]
MTAPVSISTILSNVGRPSGSTASGANTQSHFSGKLGTKVSVGVGVPIGLALAAALVYIRYFRQSRRKKVRKEQRHYVDNNTSEAGESVALDIGPHMLESRAISRPYMKPELVGKELPTRSKSELLGRELRAQHLGTADERCTWCQVLKEVLGDDTAELTNLRAMTPNNISSQGQSIPLKRSPQ